MKILKANLIMLSCLILSLLAAYVSAFAINCAELRESVLRLHVLANSNQPFDQQIKLEVRDAILAELGDQLGASANRAEAEQNAQRLLLQIEEIAQKVIQNDGRNYEAHAEIVRMYFDTRDYGNWLMPAGMYDAVRVEIGKAEGRNWWCVLYPPICVPASMDSPSGLENTVAENGKLEPRFKIVELFEKTKNWWNHKTNAENVVDK